MLYRPVRPARPVLNRVRVSRFIVIGSWLIASLTAHSEYADSWSLSVGSEIPAINMLDQDGQAQTFESLKGENGLLLFFNRSADW